MNNDKFWRILFGCLASVLLVVGCSDSANEPKNTLTENTDVIKSAERILYTSQNFPLSFEIDKHTKIKEVLINNGTGIIEAYNDCDDTTDSDFIYRYCIFNFSGKKYSKFDYDVEVFTRKNDQSPENAVRELLRTEGINPDKCNLIRDKKVPDKTFIMVLPNNQELYDKVAGDDVSRLIEKDTQNAKICSRFTYRRFDGHNGFLFGPEKSHVFLYYEYSALSDVFWLQDKNWPSPSFEFFEDI